MLLLTIECENYQSESELPLIRSSHCFICSSIYQPLHYQLLHPLPNHIFNLIVLETVYLHFTFKSFLLSVDFVLDYCCTFELHCFYFSLSSIIYVITSNTKLAAISRATSWIMLNSPCAWNRIERAPIRSNRQRLQQRNSGKNPVWKPQKTAEFSQFDALKYPLWLW